MGNIVKTKDAALSQMQGMPFQFVPLLSSGGRSVLGMRLAQPSDQTRQEYGLSDEKNGVVVEGIGQGTDAQDKGPQAGDVIVTAGSIPVKSANDVLTAVAEARQSKRSEVLLLASRNCRSSFVPVHVSGATD